MKKYLKEIIILLLQVITFYLMPMAMVTIGPITMVLLIIMLTFILSMVLGTISKSKIKYLYPVVIAILFMPSIFIYYNESASIHSLWYFVVSSVGLIIGGVIKWITTKKDANGVM